MRNARAEYAVELGRRVPATLHVADAALRAALAAELPVLCALAKLDPAAAAVEACPQGGLPAADGRVVLVVREGLEVALPLAGARPGRAGTPALTTRLRHVLCVICRRPERGLANGLLANALLGREGGVCEVAGGLGSQTPRHSSAHHLVALHLVATCRCMPCIRGGVRYTWRWCLEWGCHALTMARRPPLQSVRARC